MNVTLVELVVAALATWQVVEVWHHSSLLAPLRARGELLEGRAGELLACPFCLTVWVAVGAAVVLLAGNPPARGDAGEGVLWFLQLLGSWLGMAVAAVLAELGLRGRVREAVKTRVVYWLTLALAGLAVWGLWRPGWEWAVYGLLVLLKVALLALAVARLANLGNDLTHGWCRTPRGFDGYPPGPVKNAFEKEADCAGRTEPDGPAPPGV